MDDFRTQLHGVIEEMVANGIEPVFLVCDLDGTDYIKRAHGVESLNAFLEAAVTAVISASEGADAFTYGESRIVVILGTGYDRLKTFALIQKLRRVIPMLGQSFDCFLRPEFDVIEYEASKGVAGLVNQLVAMRTTPEVA